LRGVRGVPLRGRFWRAVALGQDVLDTSGNRASGGRYNPPGEFGALYCSDSRELCLREEATHGEGTVHVMPIEVSLELVLDLADPRLCRALDVAHAELVAEDHRTTRELGRIAREAGFEALLAPAAGGPGRNLVVFLNRLAPGSRVAPVAELEQLANTQVRLADTQ
jgi:RES domain-containing protein